MTVFFIHRDIYNVEYDVNTMNDKNKSAKRLNFLKGRLPHIPSQTNSTILFLTNIHFFQSMRYK